MKLKLSPMLNLSALAKGSRLVAKTLKPLHRIRPHKFVLRKHELFKHAFRDSGHWDFVVLHLFSLGVSLALVNTTSVVLGFFAIETMAYRLGSFQTLLARAKCSAVAEYRGFIAVVHALLTGFVLTLTILGVSSLAVFF